MPLLIPNVRTKLIFPKDRDTEISYCRLLLHDTMLNDVSYRTGTSDSRLERKTADHFLLRCCKHEFARKVMYNTII